MKCGAIILCGGNSSRMGRDKATLPFGSELMLQRIVRIVGNVVDPETTVVVASEGQILPELPASVIIARDRKAFRGPLEGLAAGLLSMPKIAEAVYVTSCDVPLLKPAFIREMFLHLGNSDIASPFHGDFCYPLASVYRPLVLSKLQSLLATNRLRVTSLLEEVHTTKVSFEALRAVDPDLLSLMNCNTQEDYEAALHSAGLI